MLNLTRDPTSVSKMRLPEIIVYEAQPSEIEQNRCPSLPWLFPSYGLSHIFRGLGRAVCGIGDRSRRLVAV
jgi:hypothetical protein